MPFSTIIYILAIITTAYLLTFKYWIMGLILFTDDICLFLLSKRGDDLFRSLCGKCCGDCCGKCVYGKGEYNEYSEISDGDDQNNEPADSDALI